MKVLEYIQHESDRQSAVADETVNMVEAWRYVANFEKLPNLKAFPRLGTISMISHLITRNSEYRQVPAVFNQGKEAVAPDLIYNAMCVWWEWASSEANYPEDINFMVKEFLDIHPYADGNGRVASLLYNHVNGSIMDPVPLPYYYGDI